MTKAIIVIAIIAVGGGVGFAGLQLSERIGDQEAQIERLRNELRTLRENAGSPAVAEAGIAPGSFDLSDETTGLADDAGVSDLELRALVAQLVKDEAVVGTITRQVEGRLDPANALVGSAAFKEGVRNTMEEIRDEQRAQQREERAERMLERTEERAREIAERLNLPPATAEELTGILIESSHAQQDMWALARSGEIPRGEMRTVMREHREETDAQIEQILTPAEYTQYQQVAQELNPFGGGRRGGFGGGPAAPVATPGQDSGGGQPPAATDGPGGGARGGF